MTRWGEIDRSIVNEKIDTDSSAMEWLIAGKSSIRLLNFFITFQEFDYSESDIANNADVSLKTVYREIPKLQEMGIINFVRNVGRAKMYTLNKESMIAKLFVRLFFEASKKKIELDDIESHTKKNQSLHVVVNSKKPK